MEDEKEFRDDDERSCKKPNFEPMLSEDQAQGSGKAGP
jgi:hypothetical protein